MPKQNKRVIRETADSFCFHMKEELCKPSNLSKRPWTNLTADFLFSKLKKHISAAETNFHSGRGIEPRKMIHVANYAMMLHDNYRKKQSVA